MKDVVMDIALKHFRPEFLNRIDEAVVFSPLGRDQIHGIAKIQIRQLEFRLADMDLSIELSDSAIDLLSEAGFDPVYGARPLKRALQQMVENPLAQKLLQGEYVAGDTILVDMKDGELSFDKQHLMQEVV